METTLNPASLAILACVNCILVTYGAVTVLVPLLKLRAAYNRTKQASEDQAERESQPELAPEPA